MTGRIAIFVLIGLGAAGQDFDFFETKIRPVLAGKCYACHGPALQAPMGGLRVNSREGLLRGGDKGPAIVPGDAGRSRLVAAIKGQTVQMPPNGKLSEVEVAAFEKWIQEGAAWPEERRAAEVEKKAAGRSSHWAFQPLQRVSKSIDALVGEKLAEKGLQRNGPADERTLARRLAYDLTGLAPGQHRKSVDELLASPQFGERWGRHWLDIARFSDAGFNNIRFPFAHTYRDWVIGALNADMPFSDFVRNQLAADLIAGNQKENLAALGFLALGFDPHRPTGIPDKIDDRIDVVTRGFLGMTVACARCHDHKYDPIPTADYYSLYGVFLNTAEPEEPALISSSAARRGFDDFYLPRIRHRLGQLRDYKRERIVALREDARRPEMLAKYQAAAEEGKNFTGAQLENLAKERNLEFYILRRFRDGVENPTEVPLEDFAYVQTEGDYNTSNNLLWEYKRVLTDYAIRSGVRGAMAVADAGAIKPAHILVRGNAADPGEEVSRHYLSALGGGEFGAGSGRRELADAILKTPLAYRVYANRVWQRLFGEGLVRTPSDFGLRGDRPAQPELLDYLAGRLMAHGSLKQLIREIVMSETYRQGSESRAEAFAKDPENLLLWRQNRRRLDFEALRDTMLQAAGRLDLRVGGPSFSLQTIPAEPRRTMYAFVERERAQALLKSFNYADPEAHTPQRHLTTIPQQALFLMNSAFVAEQAERFVDAGVEEMYAKILRRAPSLGERAGAENFLREYRVETAAPARSAWRYGTAELDEAGRVVKEFRPFQYFADGVWQNAALLPDVVSGQAQLSANGGAPGDDLRHAVARRWVAPEDGEVKITGTLTLPLDQFEIRFRYTNGIRGTILSSRHGVLGQWTLEPEPDGKGKEGPKRAKPEAGPIAVQAGDTIDFVVDSRNDYESDSFTWAPVVESADGTKKWSAAEEFAGPVSKPLDAKAALAQVLFMTNEFAHVD